MIVSYALSIHNYYNYSIYCTYFICMVIINITKKLKPCNYAIQFTTTSTLDHHSNAAFNVDVHLTKVLKNYSYI